MPIQDFFAFCTSLKPVELKALGALSESRHVEAGQTIYEPSEVANTLYIINRGIIEIVAASAEGRMPPTYLTRGDIFGDVEVLTGRPRAQFARTREAVSLRCFSRPHFAELQRRVPSFFSYLSGQLAERLIAARDTAMRQNNGLELGGSLTSFDLVTIYQTIVHSLQTGELSIVNETGELIGTFVFDAGQPLAGRFEHLNGEEAFWQLFLVEDLRGKFAFATGQPEKAIPPEQIITRKADDMLITAIHSRDEFQLLKETISASAVPKLQKRALSLEPDATAIPHPLIEQVWLRCAEHEPTVSGLYPHFSVCELKVYQAVRDLMLTGHLILATDSECQKVA